jgi:hypothetical protein
VCWQTDYFSIFASHCNMLEVPVQMLYLMSPVKRLDKGVLSITNETHFARTTAQTQCKFIIQQ